MFLGHPADINLYCCMLFFGGGGSSCVDLLQAATDEKVSRYGMKGCHFMLVMQANTGAWPLGGPPPPSVLNIYLFRVINPFSLSILLECCCRTP